MVRAVSLEQLAMEIGRGFLYLVLILLALCALRICFVSLVLPGLLWLKSLVLWATLAVLIVLVLVAVTNFVIAGVRKRMVGKADQSQE